MTNHKAAKDQCLSKLEAFEAPSDLDDGAIETVRDLVKSLLELKPKHRPRHFKDEEVALLGHAEGLLKHVLALMGSAFDLGANGPSSLQASVKLCEGAIVLAPHMSMSFFPGALITLNKALNTLGAEGIKSDMVRRARVVSEDLTSTEACKALANCIMVSDGVDLSSYKADIEVILNTAMTKVKDGILDTVDEDQHTSVMESLVSIASACGLERSVATLKMQLRKLQCVSKLGMFRGTFGTLEDAFQAEGGVAKFQAFTQTVLGYEAEHTLATGEGPEYREDFIDLADMALFRGTLDSVREIGLKQVDLAVEAAAKNLAPHVGVDDNYELKWHMDANNLNELQELAGKSIMAPGVPELKPLVEKFAEAIRDHQQPNLNAIPQSLQHESA